MSRIMTPSPAESLLLLQDLFAGLLQLLASEEAEVCDASVLDLLGAAVSEAEHAALYGVTPLLRMWSSAMARRAGTKVALSQLEKSRAYRWLLLLNSYCEGQLDERGQLEILDTFAKLPNLAPLPERLHGFLRDRLLETQPYVQQLWAGLNGLSAADPIADTDMAFAIDVDPSVMFVARNETALFDAASVAPAQDATDECPAFASPAAANRGTAYLDESAAAQLITGASDLLSMTGPLNDMRPINDDPIESKAIWPDLDPVDAPLPPEGDFAPAFGSMDFTGGDSAAEGIDAAFVQDSTVVVGSAEDIDPIWISADELALALDAVGNQILPLVVALADSSDEASRTEACAELDYNLGLVGNAMEMLGTPALSRGILALQTCVSSGLCRDPEMLGHWSASLVAFLEQMTEENADLMAALSYGVAGLDDEWAADLSSEAARVRIGMNPALIAMRKTEAFDDDVSLAVDADVLPSVLDGMLRELPGNAERLGNFIRKLVATGDIAPIDEARRVAHTLKGDANTVGVRGLANITHSLEDLLIELYRHPERLVPELGRVLDQAADCVEETADHLLGRGPLPANMRKVYQSVLDWSNAVVTDTIPTSEIHARLSTDHANDLPGHDRPAPVLIPIAAEPALAPGVYSEWKPSGTSVAAVEISEAQANRTATLTVSAELLDELQRLAGETLVMARQIDQRLGLLENMHREQESEVRNTSVLLGKLDDLISLRGAALQSTALRGGEEVDPLELDQYNELHVVSRRLLESNIDNNEYQRRVDRLVVDLDRLRGEQEAVHSDLQRMVQRARMVPFDQISGRLQRIVRQTARQLDRQVELRLVGEHTALDADLLDRIVEPLAHLLRNSVDHGLENQDEREFAGKHEPAMIQVSIRTVSDSIEIEVQDNGRGLDYEAIREKAIKLGMLGTGREVGEDELNSFILAPGFTTRREATQVSGRGIGMDVVNSRIIDLRGQLVLRSVRGQGLSVTVRLPVSQTMANVIIAYGHGMILAAVAGSVERVHNFAASDLDYSDDGQFRVLVDGEHLAVLPIESLYGRGDGRLSLPSANGLGLIVTSARGKRVLVSVSAIGEVSNVIVKPISSYLPRVPSVRGMTLLGDGRLAAVIDMGTLIDALDFDSQSWRLAHLNVERPQLPRVVVADDSLSVRRALGQLMEDAGFEVASARDGLEALELINARTPALVLLDLEMPKLNGLEVTRFMRTRAETRHVPVLMITSRASDKYRAQAENAGVSLMLGKPFADDELIVKVRQLMVNAASLARENV